MITATETTSRSNCTDQIQAALSSADSSAHGRSNRWQVERRAVGESCHSA